MEDDNALLMHILYKLYREHVIFIYFSCKILNLLKMEEIKLKLNSLWIISKVKLEFTIFTILVIFTNQMNFKNFIR
jgi:hypothetical protein